MKAMFWAGLLPVVVAGGAWILANQLPAPAAMDRPARELRPFVAVDSSGNGNDGIIQGDTVAGLPGHQGTSYTFVQRGSWIQVPSAPEINPGTRDFMVSAWVQFDEFPGPRETYDVVRKGVSYTASGDFKIEVLPRGLVRCTAKDESRTVAVVNSTAAVTDDGTWHHIGCARTGAAWSVLVDDTVRTRRIAMGSVANTVPLSIGGKYGFEDRPQGRVDDVKLFMGAPPDPATPAQPDGPADVRGAIRALEEQSPAGWWRLDETPTSAAGR